MTAGGYPSLYRSSYVMHAKKKCRKEEEDEEETLLKQIKCVCTNRILYVFLFFCVCRRLLAFGPSSK